MPTTIRQYLDGLELPAFMAELQKVQCDATFFKGKFFRLGGYEGDISYSEIVRTVYNKAKLHGGELKGKELHKHLVAVMKSSEEMLAKKPFWVRIAVRVMSIFSSATYHSTLSKIESMSGTNSLEFYAKRHISEIVELMERLGNPIKAKDVRICETCKIINGKVHEKKYTLSIQDYKFSISHDETKNLRKQFDTCKSFIQNTFPHWKKAQEQIGKFQSELEKTIFAHKSMDANVGLFSPQIQIEPRIDHEHQAFLDFGCTLHFIKDSIQLPQPLPKCTLRCKNETNYLAPLHFWIKAIDSELPAYIKKINEPYQRDFEDIFERFFGSNFADPFRSFFGGYAPQPTSRTLPIEKDLKEIETIAGIELGSLVKLYREKKYANLKNELRKAFKEASLKYHPDMLDKRKATGEEKKAAEEIFKRFGTSLERITKDLEAKV